MHTSTRLLAAVAVAGLLSQPSPAWAQTAPLPLLVITKHHTGNFTVGVNGIYTIVVSNIGGVASSGQIDVSDPLTAGALAIPVFSFVSATGTGWTCSVNGFPFDTAHCLSAAVIPAGGSAPPIALTVLPDVSGTVTNTAIVVGGGELITTHASASDVTLVLAGVPTLPQWALIALTAFVALAGVAALRRRTT
jgi:uncharacterized repeat protein (TIGR01451 family)